MGRTTARLVSWVWVLTAVFAVYAIVIFITGGFDVQLAGLRVRSRVWERPATIAAIGFLLLTWRSGLRGIDAVGRSGLDAHVTGRRLTFVAMAWTLFAGLFFNSYAIGGSDSYGYVSQARLFSHGHVTDVVPLDPAFTWPDVETTLTPLAYRHGLAPGVIAPTYPPGLPLLMSPFARWDPPVHLVVPLLGVLTVWLTFGMGAALGEPIAGAMAAVWLSVSTAFLFQLFQPMSDVPAAACWLGAWFLATKRGVRTACAAGAVASIAILIRPNLAPLAGVVALTVAGDREARWSRIGVFVGALLPLMGVLGWIQQTRYGSPWASGYGAISDLFALSNVGPNLARYPRWITEAETAVVWLWPFAPLAIAAGARWRGATAWLLAGAVWVAYLPYTYFGEHEWTYTRFLLPALPFMLTLAAIVVLRVVRLLPARPRVVATAIVCAVVGIQTMSASRNRTVFSIRQQERRYAEAGAFVRNRLPPSAFVLAMQHSGSIRYYADRPILRWDVLDAGALDRALDALRSRGYTPVLVADDWEEVDFKKRFGERGQLAVGRLKRLDGSGVTRIFGFE